MSLYIEPTSVSSKASSIGGNVKPTSVSPKSSDGGNAFETLSVAPPGQRFNTLLPTNLESASFVQSSISDSASMGGMLPMPDTSNYLVSIIIVAIIACMIYKFMPEINNMVGNDNMMMYVLGALGAGLVCYSAKSMLKGGGNYGSCGCTVGGSSCSSHYTD